MPLPTHKTKIVATIGPASRSQEMIERLLGAGMNVARLNFSHGNFQTHGETIRALRAAESSTGLPLTIMADLPGPKMRLGRIDPEPIHLRPGQFFTLTSDQVTGDAQRVSVSFESLPKVVKPGDKLFLNDGLVQIQVEKTEGKDVVCRVCVGGELRSRKGLNLPGIALGIRAFTNHDRDCLRFALQNGVDAVSQSFVERTADLAEVRSAAADLGYNPFLIAKIERAGAVDHYAEILAAADGVMVARGDLGVEVPIEEIATIQKRLIAAANLAGKPVITATQMLESMTASRLPTRAEATDVANAILDGTDCVMLSAESAAGQFPEEAVGMLARIAAVTEGRRPAAGMEELQARSRPQATSEGSMAALVEYALRVTSAAAVFVPTRTGRTARLISRFKPGVWIVAVSPDSRVRRGLAFSSGVQAVPPVQEGGPWDAFARDWAEEHSISGDSAMIISGPSEQNPTANHRIEIVRLKVAK